MHVPLGKEQKVDGGAANCLKSGHLTTFFFLHFEPPSPFPLLDEFVLERMLQSGVCVASRTGKILPRGV